VMGTHGHTALGNVVLGSVASGVLARSKVPVLLIR
jgi:nucleotide-binding universal stress UspA family protein